MNDPILQLLVPAVGLVSGLIATYVSLQNGTLLAEVRKENAELENRMQSPRRGATNVELARKCLCLIRDIADRGASSWDPEAVGYALQEISQVLLERIGTEDRMFEPVPAGEIRDLAALYVELQWVDAGSQGLCASHKCH